MTSQRSTPAASGGGVSIGNERKEDQDPTPNDAQLPDDDAVANEKPRKDRPAPAKEPSKDAPTFPTGSPENAPPGPASA
jgi:hypothetical protein